MPTALVPCKAPTPPRRGRVLSPRALRIGTRPLPWLTSQLPVVVVLERELNAEIVRREPVGVVLALAPLHLGAPHHARRGIEEDVREGVLPDVERVRRLAVAVVDVDPGVADAARRFLVPLVLEEQDGPDDRQCLADVVWLG